MQISESLVQSHLDCPRKAWRDVHAPAVAVEYTHSTLDGALAQYFHDWTNCQGDAVTTALQMAQDIGAGLFRPCLSAHGITCRPLALEATRYGWLVYGLSRGKSVKPKHLNRLSLQAHVMGALGMQVAGYRIIHLSDSYVRGDHLDLAQLFAITDVSDDVFPLSALEIDAIQSGLMGPEPDISLSLDCPKDCEHRSVCGSGLSDQWIGHLPGLTGKRAQQYIDAGHTKMADVLHSLTGIQNRAARGVLFGEEYVSADLPKLLAGFEPPCAYLDFETVAPSVPLYAGTKPFQAIAFQWSLHVLDGAKLQHFEFLADGATDPRREFAERLISAMPPDLPILVYSSYEQTILKGLAAFLPDLAADLQGIIARLLDLLPIMRGAVYLPAFGGSFSIKSVGPALCPDLSYDDLENIKDGAGAAQAIEQLANGNLSGPQADLARADLLEYCKRDTWAMVRVHQALRALASR